MHVHSGRRACVYKRVHVYAYARYEYSDTYNLMPTLQFNSALHCMSVLCMCPRTHSADGQLKSGGTPLSPTADLSKAEIRRPGLARASTFQTLPWRRSPLPLRLRSPYIIIIIVIVIIYYYYYYYYYLLCCFVIITIIIIIISIIITSITMFIITINYCYCYYHYYC